MDIYVGNLPLDASEEEIQGLFSNHGDVSSVKIVKDRETGEARGFGFIEMPNSQEAQNAIRALDGSTYKGNKLRINEARPRTPAGGGGGGFQRRPGGGGGGGGGFRGGNNSNRGPRTGGSPYSSRSR